VKTPTDEQLFAAWVDATVEAEAPPPPARARLLATLEGPRRFALVARALGRVTHLGADAVTAVLTKIDDATTWIDAPFPGVRYFNFTPGATAGAVEAGLVRLRPGARFPHHRHLGHEVSLVLDGLLEERGQVHGPGSIVKAERGTAHDYAAGPGRDLLLVSVHGGFEILP
jgi:anti-sigma factor ChrR (cupin superfamily)